MRNSKISDNKASSSKAEHFKNLTKFSSFAFTDTLIDRNSSGQVLEPKHSEKKKTRHLPSQLSSETEIKKEKFTVSKTEPRTKTDPINYSKETFDVPRSISNHFEVKETKENEAVPLGI